MGWGFGRDLSAALTTGLTSTTKHKKTAARMGNDMKPAAELLIPCSETATAIRESSEPTRNENPPNNPQPYHDLGERQR